MIEFKRKNSGTTIYFEGNTRYGTYHLVSVLDEIDVFFTRKGVVRFLGTVKKVENAKAKAENHHLRSDKNYIPKVKLKPVF